MSQLAAPKDPEQKRPYFYIMRDKEVFGAKQDDGRGIQFLYQSDGRLENGAKIVGNIDDEELLELMGTVEGLKKLVHSIGVSIECENPKEDVEFIFQMYGKKDLYGGGTNLVAKLNGDGAEKRIYLSDVTWHEDDNVPGQIKVIMNTPEKLGTISVRFYLNDGYSAPEIQEETAVDTDSEAYKTMVTKSLIQTGNTYRLVKAMDKAKAGEEITLAYIGGSITQGAGATPINTECYAYKSYSKIKELIGENAKVNFVKAGVGGTPSELGMIRFDRDVLRDGIEPDVVVIEFAVNDEGDETKGVCYESLVRKVLNLPNHPAVILLFSVFADDYNLQERLAPVGYHYNLPMVSIKDAVTPQFYDKTNRVISKNQFFYDMFHPSNIGHTIMADCLLNLYKNITESAKDETMPADYAIGGAFENVKLMDKVDKYDKAEIDCGGFVNTDNVLQSVEMDMDLSFTPEFPNNWMYDGIMVNTPWFEMKIECKALVLVFKDSGEVNAAKADVYVDGEFVRTADPHVNNWLHCNPVIIIDENTTKEHTVRIQIAEEDIQKQFTILGFGYVE